MRVFKKEAIQSIPDDGLTNCQQITPIPTHSLTITTTRQQNRFEGISLKKLLVFAEKETLCLANHLHHHSSIKYITFSCSSFHSSSSHYE